MPTSKTKLICQRANLYIELLHKKNKKCITPVVADLFITNRCNANCHYCYTDKSISIIEELSTEQWKRVIDGLIERGCRMINLMGGEPLLRSDFNEILEHVISHNILCDVNTNCFLVPKHISELTKVSQIFTSLDGDEEAHDRNRGKGSFAKTVNGIRCAREAKIPVRVNCTVTRHNTHCIESLVKLCDELNLHLTFTPLIRIRDILQKKAIHLQISDAEVRKMFLRIKKAKKYTRRIMNSDASIDFIINYPKPIGTIVHRNEKGSAAEYYKQRCPYGVLQHFISSNGDVFPCHNMWNDPSFHPLNTITDGLDKALNHSSKLWCKYCWLANLVEWNEFTKPSWFFRGVAMTIQQITGK